METRLNQWITTGTGTAGTLLLPRLILGPLLEEVDKFLLPRELAAEVFSPAMLANKGGVFNINLDVPNSLDVRETGEGAEIPMDAMEHTNVTFTPTKFGVAIRITREMMEDTQFELLNRNIRMTGKRFGEKETELIIDLLVAGTGATTAGGDAVTIANIVESMFDLEDNDYSPSDFLIGTEILQDLRNIDTFVEANKVGNTDMLRRGFLGTVYGMNVVRFSTNAVSTAAYRRRAFVIDRLHAYMLAIWRDITVENFDLPLFDMQGAAITWRFDTQIKRSEAVSMITTN